MITQSVAQYIGKHHLLDKQGIHLVALSGGADSVALLLVLRDLGYDLHATHCNFHLRGNESDRDEQFCVQICEKLGVPLHRAHFDTHAYAEAHHVSIEMAARELRYQYFRQLKDDIKAKDICAALRKSPRNRSIPRGERARLCDRQHELGGRRKPQQDTLTGHTANGKNQSCHQGAYCPNGRVHDRRA